MKTCKECGISISPQYEYCYNHNIARRTTQNNNGPSITQWHDDPIVDALLKINHNLLSIKKLLETTVDKLPTEIRTEQPEPQTDET